MKEKKQGAILRVTGKVQGVGFRPFVWQLAQQFQLSGNVSNDAQGVLIYLAANSEQCEQFIIALKEHCPPLAFIENIVASPWNFDYQPDTFEINTTAQGNMTTHIVPDAATCPACLAEMNDPNEHRYHYPFINCTHCGPRFTIIEKMPYDRPFTTMRNFPLCQSCQKEYENPADRRFHAQPVACLSCGPTIWCEDPRLDHTISHANALNYVVERLHHGEIVAIKGIGGFHLVCDAQNHHAVMQLRKRKQRPNKPFAIVIADDGSLSQYCQINDEAALLAVLRSRAAPIVLVPAAKSSTLSPAIAPRLAEIGVMFPSNPLHHLLIQQFGHPLVMTSGNANGLPPAMKNQEAFIDLKNIAHVWLVHNRSIVQRTDDSVVRWRENENKVEMIRRSRGYVPDAIYFPPGFTSAPAILATGADLKNCFCLVRNDHFLLSQHWGDLHEQRTFTQWKTGIQHFCQLFSFQPTQIVTDQHPDYRCHHWAKSQTLFKNVQLEKVLHHHAHAAACLVEHNWPLRQGPVVALTLDGLGYGANNSLWGGECLLVDYLQCQHLGGLPATALPGGEIAAKQPWRNLLAHMQHYVPNWQTIAELAWLNTDDTQCLSAAIKKGINSPHASSCGRLFDAIAAVLQGDFANQTWEGEMASYLETLAAKAQGLPHSVTLPLITLPTQPDTLLDLATFWQQWLFYKAPLAERAWAFHDALAQGFADLARKYCQRYHIDHVILSGGVWHNRLLKERLIAKLPEYTVLYSTKIPTNDGSIALGQAAIAVARAQMGYIEKELPPSKSIYCTQ